MFFASLFFVFRAFFVNSFSLWLLLIAELLTFIIGRKLFGKTRDQILEEILLRFHGLNIVAVQQFPETIRVTFVSEETALAVLKSNGVRLFDFWCRMDGGPPSTIIHLFDFPYEGGEEEIQTLFKSYGTVKAVWFQKYFSCDTIFMGTHLTDLVMEKLTPRMVSINGYICRVWFKGQPVVCNSCGVQGHKASECPDKDKCRLCGDNGHIAHQCTNAWGRNLPPASDSHADGAA